MSNTLLLLCSRERWNRERGKKKLKGLRKETTKMCFYFSSFILKGCRWWGFCNEMSFEFELWVFVSHMGHRGFDGGFVLTPRVPYMSLTCDEFKHQGPSFYLTNAQPNNFHIHIDIMTYLPSIITQFIHPAFLSFNSTSS